MVFVPHSDAMYKSEYLRIRGELFTHHDEFINICKEKEEKRYRSLRVAWGYYHRINREFLIGLLVFLFHGTIFSAFSFFLAETPIADALTEVIIMGIFAISGFFILPFLKTELFRIGDLDTVTSRGLPVMSIAVGVYFSLIYLFAIAFALQIELSMDECLDFNKSLFMGDLIYFSGVTITTLGYGDINPVSTGCRITANLEAITGVLFITYSIVMITTIIIEQTGRLSIIREITREIVDSTKSRILNLYEVNSGKPLEDPENFTEGVLSMWLFDWFDSKKRHKKG